MRRPSYFLLFQTRPDAYNARGVRMFLVVYFGAFLLGALMGPMMYALVQGVAISRETVDEGLLAYLAGKSLDVYIDRVRLVAAAFSMLWLIHYCGLWGRFGFHWREGGFRTGMRWGLAGVGTLGIVVGMQWFFGNPVFRETATIGEWAEVLMMAVAGAVILSFLEEALFRGMLLRLFFTAFRPWPAVFLSAFVFAAVHFKRVPVDPALTEVWWGGFVVAGKMAFAFVHQFEFLPFLNLFLAGVALNLVFLWKRSLIACMGLHAGWVLVRNTYTDLVHSSETGVFLGSKLLVDGILCAVVLLFVILVLSYAHRFRTYQAPPERGLGSGS